MSWPVRRLRDAEQLLQPILRELVLKSIADIFDRQVELVPLGVEGAMSADVYDLRFLPDDLLQRWEVDGFSQDSEFLSGGLQVVDDVEVFSFDVQRRVTGFEDALGCQPGNWLGVQVGHVGWP